MAEEKGQIGLDGRHRDVDGRIDRKHGNTLVKTLRETYGSHFAQGMRGDMKLDTLLKRTSCESLSQYLKTHGFKVVKFNFNLKYLT
jgi:hypothetical protein